MLCVVSIWTSMLENWLLCWELLVRENRPF